LVGEKSPDHTDSLLNCCSASGKDVKNGAACAHITKTMREKNVMKTRNTSRSGNHLVFAFAGERGADSVRSQLRNAEGSEAARRLAREAASEMSDLAPPLRTPVFTDDHAPVEEITRRMLAKYRSVTL